MLEKSFIHLPGIGPETERRLWSLGLHTWNDLRQDVHAHFGAKKADSIARALDESFEARDAGEFEYFKGGLKGSETWRLFPAMREQGLADKVAYLDIETTGLGFPPASHSTAIAVVYNGRLYQEHEYRRKLELLKEVDAEAKLLVTFNGGPFDLPYLRAEFELELANLHLDLRFWYRQLGYRGGLKKIQTALPDLTKRSSMDIDGFDAVRLWRMHEYGVPRALETLLTYNAEDTVVLEQMVYCGLNFESERRPQLKLPTYIPPRTQSIPTEVCPQVYRLLRQGRRF